MIANQGIKAEAKKHGVKLWRIAEKYGISDSSFSRKLRHELPPEEKTKIRKIIHDLAAN